MFSFIGINKNGCDCWISEEKLKDLDNYAAKINDAIISSDYFLVIISENSIISGHVLTELYQASQYNTHKIPVRISKIPLTPEWTYHLPNNAVEYYKMDDKTFFEILLDKLNCNSEEIDISRSKTDNVHIKYKNMSIHTDNIFKNVTMFGGYSWGINKSVVQNLDGGWMLENVIIEKADMEHFSFSDKYNTSFQVFEKMNSSYM